MNVDDLIRAWCRLGLDPRLYWESTSHVAGVIADGALQRSYDEHDRLAWLAWNSAALARTKRLPPLKSLLSKRRSRKRAQTWQEMRDTARLITLAHGGKTA